MCVSQSDKISAAQPQQQQLNLAHHPSKASAVSSSQRFLLALPGRAAHSDVLRRDRTQAAKLERAIREGKQLRASDGNVK